MPRALPVAVAGLLVFFSGVVVHLARQYGLWWPWALMICVLSSSLGVLQWPFYRRAYIRVSERGLCARFARSPLLATLFQELGLFHTRELVEWADIVEIRLVNFLMGRQGATKALRVRLRVTPGSPVYCIDYHLVSHKKRLLARLEAYARGHGFVFDRKVLWEPRYMLRKVF